MPALSERRVVVIIKERLQRLQFWGKRPIQSKSLDPAIPGLSGLGSSTELDTQTVEGVLPATLFTYYDEDPPEYTQEDQQPSGMTTPSSYHTSRSRMTTPSSFYTSQSHPSMIHSTPLTYNGPESKAEWVHEGLS
jgi:hypothetical protein